jgi:hypothetical protein
MRNFLGTDMGPPLVNPCRPELEKETCQSGSRRSAAANLGRDCLTPRLDVKPASTLYRLGYGAGWRASGPTIGNELPEKTMRVYRAHLLNAARGVRIIVEKS